MIHMVNHMENLMGRQRLDKRNIRKIQHTHGSYHVSIPIDIIREMKLKEREKVVFEYDKRNKIIKIKDWKK